MSLYKSNSLNVIKYNYNSPKFQNIKVQKFSPTIIKQKINYLKNNSNSITKNKCNSVTSRSSRFSNHYIFMKREKIFNKSLKEKRSIFKYLKYTLFDERKRNINNKNKCSKHNILNNKSSSLYLTENLIKTDKYMFQFIQRENSSILELDNNEYSNNIDNIDIFKNKKKTIFNNYNNFGRKRKKINLKIINDKYLLKTFDINRIKEKELENKTLNKNQKNKNLFNKTKIFEQCKNKELTRIKCIDNIKDYIKIKMKLNKRKEKAKIINENFQDKLDLYDNKILDVKNNYDSFNNNFLNKLEQYIRQMYNKITIEKDKNDKLLVYINNLKQKIRNIKLKIKKYKNNFDELNNYIYMLICIEEKRKILPNYCKIIIENKIDENKDDLKKLNKKEIERILNYKYILVDLGPEYLLNQIKRYENENIDLLNRFNSSRKEIILLNKEKEELKKSIHKSGSNVSDELIESKKIILLNLKKKYNKLIYDKKILYFNSNKEDEDEDNIKIKKNALYSKINKIVSNISKYIKYNFGESKLLIRGNKETTLILYNLSKLEILVNIFNNKIEEYKNKHPSKMQLLHMLIDKNKKLRKYLEQKEINELKEKYEKKRIIEKNNKLIIVPVHKVCNNNIISKNFILKNNDKIKKKLKIETLYDYINE